MSVINRWMRTLLYQDVDRAPNTEFGFWQETIREWKPQGLPDDLPEDLFDRRLKLYFDMDVPPTVDIVFKLDMNPPYTVEILEEDENTRVERGENGVVLRHFTDQPDENIVPQFISFPVSNMDDFKRMRDEHFRLDDPARTIDPAIWDEVRRKLQNPECMVQCRVGSIYGWPRDWMGMEHLAIAFYEQPELVEAMMDLVVDLALHGLKQMPDDIPIHYATWWEDMCFKNGPLISPKLFKEFMLPRYKTVMAEVAKHDCQLSEVDSDGNITELAPLWLEAGINVMMPCEVTGNTDIFQLRKDHGREMRFTGGIDKMELTKDEKAIDAEIDRVAPLVADGGFIPHLDHTVPPVVPLDNFWYYMRRKQRMLEEVKPWSKESE